MTKADTWMPLYVADYLSDTAHLTTEQHGAYFLMLMTAWKRDGRLPDDDVQLAAVCRLPAKVWKAHAQILRSFFRQEAGELVHGRVQRECAKAREITEKRRQAGLKGGRPAKQNESEPKANGFAKDKQTETPSPSPKPVEDYPDRSETKEPQQNGVAVRSRGTRLPANWKVGSDEILYAIQEHGFTDAAAFKMAEDFRDFWHAKSGADAVKVDWLATWRRWVREEAKRGMGRPRYATPPKRVSFV